MKRNWLVTLLMAAALVLVVGLAGCGGNKDEASDGKGVFDAIGYQGTLDDGCAIVYIQLGKANAMVSFTDNGDGTAEVEAEGHGKGKVKAYEGKVFEMVSQMADDDAED